MLLLLLLSLRLFVGTKGRTAKYGVKTILILFWMEDEVIIQWGINFGPGGWKYISSRMGNKSDEYYNNRFSSFVFLYVDMMHCAQNIKISA